MGLVSDILHEATTSLIQPLVVQKLGSVANSEKHILFLAGRRDSPSHTEHDVGGRIEEIKRKTVHKAPLNSRTD